MQAQGMFEVTCLQSLKLYRPPSECGPPVRRCTWHGTTHSGAHCDSAAWFAYPELQRCQGPGACTAVSQRRKVRRPLLLSLKPSQSTSQLGWPTCHSPSSSACGLCLATARGVRGGGPAWREVDTWLQRGSLLGLALKPAQGCEAIWKRHLQAAESLRRPSKVHWHHPCTSLHGMKQWRPFWPLPGHAK